MGTKVGTQDAISKEPILQVEFPTCFLVWVMSLDLRFDLDLAFIIYLPSTVH